MQFNNNNNDNTLKILNFISKESVKNSDTNLMLCKNRFKNYKIWIFCKCLIVINIK